MKERQVHCSHVEVEQDGFPWYSDVKKYLETRSYLGMQYSTRRSRYVVWVSICF